ncbi:NAD(P)/FAD-dependent oxidoreductase [Pedobacter gandavensis]|uniref:flavin-containing monooxygenase n=1 Tax=Pedobacter TaxID=84567 RepID=UPI001C99D0DA|nr:MULTISPECIES: NAD(P)/FAD-dependent oxidoreductase [Pedobacter]WGQ09965.1 NAD(P)/FAD-dependent oxidoreductase [Pedobacter gandavensis]
MNGYPSSNSGSSSDQDSYISVEVLIIGGGQAGLAMSYCLKQRNISHILLERGQIAQRWRSESWDSLRLLTPNDQTNLPSWPYQGDQPEGFMPVGRYISLLEDYAQSFEAPILTETAVEAVSKSGHQFYIHSTAQRWVANAVVIATGHCCTPVIPEYSNRVNPEIHQITASQYLNPGQIPEGGILVVGAGASGVQIAEELRLSGREVMLSVGKHRRLPRRYRGKDILTWLKEAGIFDAFTDSKCDPNIPAPQLIGSEDAHSINLETLQNQGVKLTSRIAAINDSQVSFEDNLLTAVHQADQDMYALLERIDQYINDLMIDHSMNFHQVAPISVPPAPSSIDLKSAGIKTIIWATGYRRSYPWLHIDVLDAQGEIKHQGGITAIPGLLVLGMRRQIRYNSNFIDGVGKDAELLADYLKKHLS